MNHGPHPGHRPPPHGGCCMVAMLELLGAMALIALLISLLF